MRGPTVLSVATSAAAGSAAPASSRQTAACGERIGSVQRRTGCDQAREPDLRRRRPCALPGHRLPCLGDRGFAHDMGAGERPVRTRRQAAAPDAGEAARADVAPGAAAPRSCDAASSSAPSSTTSPPDRSTSGALTAIVPARVGSPPVALMSPRSSSASKSPPGTRMLSATIVTRPPKPSGALAWITLRSITRTLGSIAMLPAVGSAPPATEVVTALSRRTMTSLTRSRISPPPADTVSVVILPASISSRSAATAMLPASPLPELVVKICPPSSSSMWSANTVTVPAAPLESVSLEISAPLISRMWSAVTVTSPPWPALARLALAEMPVWFTVGSVPTSAKMVPARTTMSPPSPAPFVPLKMRPSLTNSIRSASTVTVPASPAVLVALLSRPASRSTSSPAATVTLPASLSLVGAPSALAKMPLGKPPAFRPAIRSVSLALTRTSPPAPTLSLSGLEMIWPPSSSVRRSAETVTIPASPSAKLLLLTAPPLRMASVSAATSTVPASPAVRVELVIRPPARISSTPAVTVRSPASAVALLAPSALAKMPLGKPPAFRPAIRSVSLALTRTSPPAPTLSLSGLEMIWPPSSSLMRPAETITLPASPSPKVLLLTPGPLRMVSASALTSTVPASPAVKVELLITPSRISISPALTATSPAFSRLATAPSAVAKMPLRISPALSPAISRRSPAVTRTLPPAPVLS